jgi:diguanylate cyclase (GGDEF)-like protein
MPTDASGRGGNARHFETMAIAALTAGDLALGRQLVALAGATPGLGMPDERVDCAVAQALLAQLQGRSADALAHLATVRAIAADDGIDGLSLRVRCQFFLQASTLQAAAGNSAQALADLQHWQALHRRQDSQAHRAHYQSTALHTELLRLTHRLQDSQAKRRATERSRAQLAAINAQLARKMAEVQALQQALRQQATVDALTGLHNRRHLNEVLPAQVAIARRSATPLAVVLIDLDHFKAVNDRHGHPAGDALLAAFGQMLAGSLRKSDLACRYGGEEFCLLLPRSTALAARRKVQALLRRWRQTQFQFAALPSQGHSFSAGVADTGDSALGSEALLNAADQALLAAKQAGRNRVLLASPADAAAAQDLQIAA